MTHKKYTLFNRFLCWNIGKHTSITISRKPYLYCKECCICGLRVPSIGPLDSDKVTIPTFLWAITGDIFHMKYREGY